jgi:ubiquinone/menaquinone biosynthesis C-methylase UbiE
MATSLETIRDQQKATWNKFSPGWKKFDDFTMDFLRSSGEKIISELHLKDTDHVLDIASGTGEPGFTIARIVKNGSVTITDLAEGMLDVANEKVRAMGLSNINSQVADVTALPFADNTFDAVSCRFGFMFFPDMVLAAKEIKRVLKPGGRVATSVWGAPVKNVWITAIMNSIKLYIDVPAPPPGAPGILRCAAPGMISGVFAEAGLREAKEFEVAGAVDYDSVEYYWEYMNGVVAPVVSAMSQADAETVARIKQATVDTLQKNNPANPAVIDYSATVISAVK